MSVHIHFQTGVCKVSDRKTKKNLELWLCEHAFARMHECIQYVLCLPVVSVSIQLRVKHANVGLRLRKGVPRVRLPPNSIQRCKYRLCVPCTHWLTLTMYIFKGEFINSWFALILRLFADAVCSAHSWNGNIRFARHHSCHFAAGG